MKLRRVVVDLCRRRWSLLEAAVVVCLRALYYPEGFRFPLVMMPERMAIHRGPARSDATIHDARRGRRSHREGCPRSVLRLRFSLRRVGPRLLPRTLPVPGLAVGSLATWDILFLIPVPWVSPVLFPVLVSLLLVAGFVLHEILRAPRSADPPVAPRVARRVAGRGSSCSCRSAGARVPCSPARTRTTSCISSPPASSPRWSRSREPAGGRCAPERRSARDRLEQRPIPRRVLRGCAPARCRFPCDRPSALRAARPSSSRQRP